LALNGGEWSASHPGHSSWGKSPWHPLDRLGGPQSWPGCSGRQKEFLHSPAGNKTLVVQPVA